MLNPISIGLQNLLALATELERVDQIYRENGFDEGYCQRTILHPCGTPACAWGHYITMRALPNTDQGILDSQAPFGISFCESLELFGQFGCSDARTAGQAASYIRRFMEKKIDAMVQASNR
jgi:hypothetical protein